MQHKVRYTQNDINAELLASLAKLELSEEEKQSFLADMCDMANYTYEKLGCESADGTLAFALSQEKTLDGLREDLCVRYEHPEDIVALAPKVESNMIAVPQTVVSKEEVV